MRIEKGNDGVTQHESREHREAETYTATVKGQKCEQQRDQAHEHQNKHDFNIIPLGPENPNPTNAQLFAN